MKLECTSCKTRYNVADAIIPPLGAKIRCRKCGAVILVPAHGEAASPAPPVTPATAEPAVPASAPRPEAFTPPGHVTVTPASSRAGGAADATRGAGYSLMGEPAPKRASAPAPLPAAAPANTAVTTPSFAAETGIPAGLSEEEKKAHERARRLARVLASDIAIYNQEKKARGLEEGNLVAVLGYEIKKSWEIYKERVGSDLANATPYFRNALNDLLAEGKKIF